jgi:YfiR/HmsC-like
MNPVIRTALAAAIATLVACASIAAADIDSRTDVAVKAAFLYNFAKFTDWPSLEPATTLTLCVVGDTSLAKALVKTVAGQNIGGHPLAVNGITGDAPVRSCHLLFVSTSAISGVTPVLTALKTQPILTVSDGKDFARSTGIIELFVENDGRMRFAINTDSVERAGLRLSSRLLGLARIVRDDHVD